MPLQPLNAATNYFCRVRVAKAKSDWKWRVLCGDRVISQGASWWRWLAERRAEKALEKHAKGYVKRG